MQTYGSIIPGAAAIARLVPEGTARVRKERLAAEEEAKLSGGAKHRLKVIRWHEERGARVSRTALHFSHSRTTIQAWLGRYKAKGAGGLEDESHRPHNLRKPTWSEELEGAVLKLRQLYPRWGKDKLVVLLKRQGTQVSTSMVGRILGHLKATGQLVEPLPQRRRRKGLPPRPYAIRKPKGYLAKEPGDIVEVDTVDLRPLPGVSLKHFTACDIFSPGTCSASTHGQPRTLRRCSSRTYWHALPSK